MVRALAGGARPRPEGASTTPSSPAERFLAELGRALHGYGLPAYRLEDSLTRVAGHLGLELQVFSTPTALQLAIGPSDAQRAYLLRIPPGEISLARIVEADALIDELCSGRLDVDQARARLAASTTAPAPFGAGSVLAAFALASAAAARFFGGAASEVLASAAIGLVIGTCALASRRYERVARIFEFLASFLAAATAVALAAWVGDGPRTPSPQLVMLSALIVLVPGYTLTVALNELAARHLVSGTARFASAIMSFLGLGFGVALGGRGAELLFGVDLAREVSSPSLPGWTEYVALAVAPLAFTVLFQARKRDAAWILVAGVVAFLGARFGAALLGPELGTFLAALVLGAGSNVLARMLRRPASVTLAPGLLLLVPGSLGFRSLSAFFANDAASGIVLVYTTLLVATALVAGLLFANFIVSPRRTL